MREVIRSSKKIRRNKVFNITVLFVCVVVFIFLVVGHISQRDSFLLKEVEISGVKSVPRDKIFEIVRENLLGRYLNLFPRSNFVLYPKENIEKLILDKFIKIKSVYINDKNINKLVIDIKEREPKFIWCPLENDCYYTDYEGFVFEQSPELSPGVFFKIKGGLGAREKSSNYFGKYLMGTEKLLKLLSFKDETERIIKKELNTKWNVSSFEIIGMDDYAINFSDEIGHGWKIIFVGRDEVYRSNTPASSGTVLKLDENSGSVDLELGLINSVRNLEALLISPAFKAGLDKDGNNIEYVDLRFGKKIFYRFYGDKSTDSLNSSGVVQ